MKKYKYGDLLITVEDEGDATPEEIKKRVKDAIKVAKHSEKKHVHDTKSCCICGKEIQGWGNNPWGALDKDGNEIEWKPEEDCCKECNDKYVISGRLYKAGVIDKFVPVPEKK